MLLLLVPCRLCGCDPGHQRDGCFSSWWAVCYTAWIYRRTIQQNCGPGNSSISGIFCQEDSSSSCEEDQHGCNLWAGPAGVRRYCCSPAEKAGGFVWGGTLPLTAWAPQSVCLAHSYVHMLLFLIKLFDILSPSRWYRRLAVSSVVEDVWNSGGCGRRGGLFLGEGAAVGSGSVHH